MSGEEEIPVEKAEFGTEKDRLTWFFIGQDAVAGYLRQAREIANKPGFLGKRRSAEDVEKEAQVMLYKSLAGWAQAELKRRGVSQIRVAVQGLGDDVREGGEPVMDMTKVKDYLGNNGSVWDSEVMYYRDRTELNGKLPREIEMMGPLKSGEEGVGRAYKCWLVRS